MLFQRASTVMAAEIIDEDGLVNGRIYISASIWRDYYVCKHKNKTPEEIDAILDPDFVPPGWLETDSEPPNLEPPIKKVRLSLKRVLAGSLLLFLVRSLIKQQRELFLLIP